MPHNCRNSWVVGQTKDRLPAANIEMGPSLGPADHHRRSRRAKSGRGHGSGTARVAEGGERRRHHSQHEKDLGRERM
jgi:hypothetical protein